MLSKTYQKIFFSLLPCFLLVIGFFFLPSSPIDPLNILDFKRSFILLFFLLGLQFFFFVPAWYLRKKKLIKKNLIKEFFFLGLFTPSFFFPCIAKEEAKEYSGKVFVLFITYLLGMGSRYSFFALFLEIKLLPLFFFLFWGLPLLSGGFVLILQKKERKKI